MPSVPKRVADRCGEFGVQLTSRNDRNVRSHVPDRALVLMRDNDQLVDRIVIGNITGRRYCGDSQESQRGNRSTSDGVVAHLASHLIGMTECSNCPPLASRIHDLDQVGMPGVFLCLRNQQRELPEWAFALYKTKG